MAELKPCPFCGNRMEGYPDYTISLAVTTMRDDTISRAAAIDALHEYRTSNGLFYRENHELVSVGYVEETLLKLPSAQPERKKGKWTEDNACEFCGFQPWYEGDIHTLSFCPNCGADMRGEQT